MAKEYAKSFYKSMVWLKCRKAYIDERIFIDGGLCELCHTNLGYIVHHKINITPENIDDATITLNFDNLQYVCKACHDEQDAHFVKRAKPLVLFDKNGQPMPNDTEG